MDTNEHDVQHITPAGRSVFYDLFSPEETADLEIRSLLLSGLGSWLRRSNLAAPDAAKVLDVHPSCLSDIKHGRIDEFNIDLLVKLATRAGLHLQMELEAV